MTNNTEVVRRLFNILCSYKKQSPELHSYLLNVISTSYWPKQKLLVEHQDVAKNSFFVFDGYLAVYGFDEFGNRQVLNIAGKNTIVLSRSFMKQSPSAFEYVALSGAYLAMLSYEHTNYICKKYPEIEEVTRLILTENNEGSEMRLHTLNHNAESVILNFYRNHAEFLKSNLMLDIDLASYLLIGVQTLRNVRMKLKRSHRLNIDVNKS